MIRPAISGKSSEGDRMKVRTIRTIACAAAAVSSAVVSTAFGQTFWTAGTGNWNTPANWTLGVPNAGSGTAFDAVINNGGTAQLLAPPNGSVRRFRIGRSTGTGNVLVDAATLSVTENLFLNEGSAGTSSLTVRNGATLTAPSTILGQSSTHVTNTLITGNGSKLNATTELVVGQSSTDWAFLKVE